MVLSRDFDQTRFLRVLASDKEEKANHVSKVIDYLTGEFYAEIACDKL